MDEGWVKAHRSMMEHAIWADDFLVKLLLWCVFRANYESKTVFGVPLEKGQFITGRKRGADEVGVTESRFYRGLHRLEKLGTISLKSNSDRTTITVCNYESYQADKRKSEQQPNSNRTATEQQPNTDKELNNPIRKELKKEEHTNHTPSSAVADGESAPPKTSYTESFERWYRNYPRKIGKQEAASAFGRALKRAAASSARPPDSDPLGWLCDVTQRFADSPAGKAGRFVPHPATWLNQGRFEDDEREWNRADRAGNGRNAPTFGAGQIHDASAADSQAGRM